MIGVIGSQESPQKRGLARSFASALFECLLEGAELLPYALVILVGFGALLVGFGALYFIGIVAYEMIFDPNARDVASRLASLSLDPGKWTRGPHSS
jgi:hypothetical protein